MVKIIMHGCNGAMGQVITKLAAEDKDAEITAGIDRVDNRENPYPVFTSCDACDVEADVIVDFSVAQAVDGVLAYALKRKMPLVLCTTGLSEKQLEDVKTASAQIPILRSANMSLGVNTVFKRQLQRFSVKSVMTLRLLRSITTRRWMHRPEQHWRLQMRSMRLWMIAIHTNWIVQQNVPEERPMRSVSRLSEAVQLSASMKSFSVVRMK